MPLQIIATDGIFTEPNEKEVFAAVTESFLKHHNLVGNKFMTPNVIGEITIVPRGRTFAGGKPDNLVIIEIKAPSFALTSQEQKQAFVMEVTEAALKSSSGRVSRERVYVNMVYAVDGLWGIGGRAFTNQELGEAIADASVS
ncbi:MAG: hypothetical protein WA123_07115 [Methylotenera sp.]